MVSALILGGKAICCSASCWILWLLFFLLPLQTYPQPCTSSCGKIPNITHPFRLKQDPDHCGDKRYEMGCVNNVAVLKLFYGEFYVQSINYHNYTIRLVDPNIQPTNCSSLPRFILYSYNFTDNSYNDWSSWYFMNDTGVPVQLNFPVIYLDCTSPPSNDAYYVDTASCINQHIYAIPGDLKLGRLKPQCHVKLVTLTSYPYFDYDNVTYVDIQRALSYGFELSWLQGVCPCDPGYCYLDNITREVVCADGSLEKCAFYYDKILAPCGIRSVFQLIADCAIGFYEGLRLLIGMSRDYEYEDRNYAFIGIIIGKYVLPYYTAGRFTLGIIVFSVLLLYTWRRRHTSIYGNIEDFLQGNALMPIRYSYKEIKLMTKGFKDKLGEGGYGYVYKGKLRSGPFVAIKMLKKSKANGQEFISEVATIGRIHHSNVVRLIGFCVEGSKRALVYEFMPNGSLDRIIFSKEGSISLTYEKVYEISLGVARGISYLHQGCDMQILHFDIKPHNILLDENFIPKVSDFGLAKLYPTDNSIVTLTAARGTIGYMAPELFYQNIGRVSSKADVYSFGMLLMEMASRRKNLNPHVEHTSQLYFPFWIYDQLGENKETEIEDVIKEEINDVVKKMFIVALWCIQLKPIDRPSMNKVIEMLEGELENIEMPPKPSLYPHETIQEDLDINSNQTASDIGSTSYVEESTTNPLLKYSA